MKTQAHHSHLIATTLLTVAAFVPIVSPGSRASAAVVDIPDPGLEAAIRFTLGIPTDPITDVDLAGLISLDAHGGGITDLTGLEYCVNMQILWLHNNSISDLGPLSGLTSLWGLQLENNGVSDLGPLSGLTDLVALCLSNNNISDIQPLVDNGGLDAGDQVGLQGNPLSCKAITVDIPILQGRLVDVLFDPLAFLHDVSIRPRLLSLESTGRWITGSIRSPEGCEVEDIDVASIRLEDSLEVQRSYLSRRGGKLTVRFDQSQLLAMVEPGEVELTLTGEFASGLRFQASDTIRVINGRAWLPGIFSADD